MTDLSRRSLLMAATSLATASLAATSLPATLALAQQAQPAAPASGPAPAPNPFRYDEVVRRARELSAVPYDPGPATLPEPFSRLDFDAWRDIRFRPDRALLAQSGGPFRMHMFHLGFLYQRPVTVNVIRDGVPTPIAYQPQLFDFGRTKIDRPLPMNFGFAGFRLHYPLNDPRIFDELIAFVGASYFRALGRGQQYGLSARGLAIGAGAADEEFPHFREFWIEQPRPDDDRAIIYALLDSASTTGAYQFLVYPSEATTVEVTATLFPRRTITKLGIAPLTSMFFTGENDRRFHDDYRSELHDSDGLLIHSASGEWIWRPLRNPVQPSVSAFVENNVRGFGLVQRDRVFEHYQDLDLAYELRPSYWIEPREGWGEGHVELIELPTADETNDNIVALWVPRVPLEAGQTRVYRYALRSLMDTDSLHRGGRAINTYQARPKALGSGEPVPLGARRFIVDFAGGDLAFYLRDPDRVQLVPSISAGKVTRTFLVPNPKTQGFRAGIDILLEPGQSADLRAFLRAGNRALTETWIYPWTAPA